MVTDRLWGNDYSPTDKQIRGRKSYKMLSIILKMIENHEPIDKIMYAIANLYNRGLYSSGAYSSVDLLLRDNNIRSPEMKRVTARFNLTPRSPSFDFGVTD